MLTDEHHAVCLHSSHSRCQARNRSRGAVATSSMSSARGGIESELDPRGVGTSRIKSESDESARGGIESESGE